jgi:hypothetical protein
MAQDYNSGSLAYRQGKKKDKIHSFDWIETLTPSNVQMYQQSGTGTSTR